MNELYELFERHTIHLSNALLCYVTSGELTPELEAVIDEPNYQACLENVLRLRSREYAELVGV